MSGEVISIYELLPSLEASNDGTKEKPTIHDDYINYSSDGFFILGESPTIKPANDNFSPYNQSEKDLLLHIGLDRVISKIRDSVKKKLDNWYFSLLFEDEHKYFSWLLNSLLSQWNILTLWNEDIFLYIEAQLEKYGIRERTLSIILEY